MRISEDDKDRLFLGPEHWPVLHTLLESYREEGIFILADHHTANHCLPVMKFRCHQRSDYPLIVIDPGDQNKNIDTVMFIWNRLLELNASRDSLLVCLGGGMITDIGAFAASTFKRGMDFILIPTSLLAMVDASIGGKTGINVSGIKNQVGNFALPRALFVFPEFLETLPQREFISGCAEMLKHSLLGGESHYNALVGDSFASGNMNENLIYESARIKMSVVEKDLTEKGWRKVLNYGHTIGHALEAYSMRHDTQPLTHGEAIAAGIVCETFLSGKLLGFPTRQLEMVANLILWYFPAYSIDISALNELLEIMRFDKKNKSDSRINFTLLKEIGQPVIDQFPSEKLITESLHFYLNLEYCLLPPDSR